MAKVINKNLKHLITSYKNGNKGAVLEGSSRSGKTYSSIHFIIYLCANSEKPLTINIVKETYNSFKTTLYDDFSHILDDFGLDNPFNRSKEISTFKIFNHKINLLGADNPSKFHGASSDYLWINEALDVSQAIFDQSEMRCRNFFWMDYNPSVTLHYIYDSVIPRDDVSYLKTTFKDNPFISENEKKKILSYEPTKENKRQGTADDYMWKVYGLGERMNRTGLVFPDVNWIDEFPKDIEKIGYGQDFGYTSDPSATVKTGINGNNLYIELLVYEPTKNADVLSPLLFATTNKDSIIWADSADPGMIGDLRKLGHKVFGVKKFHGSIEFGIGMIKKYKIHIVKNRHAQREQENYAWKTINGIALDIPIDDHNHMWDAVRYSMIMNFR